MHACEGEMVCESINPKIPYFNAPIYLENKVGKARRYKGEDMYLRFARPRLEKLTKFWDRSTKSILPSNRKKELSQHLLKLVTNFTLEEISYCR